MAQLPDGAGQTRSTAQDVLQNRRASRTIGMKGGGENWLAREIKNERIEYYLRVANQLV